MKSSISPDHPTDFWIKRWILGVCVPIPLLYKGLIFIFTQHGYALETRGHYAEIVGFHAVCAGLFYTGSGVGLFSYFFAPYSRYFSTYSEYWICAGAVTAAFGIFATQIMFLFG